MEPSSTELILRRRKVAVPLWVKNGVDLLSVAGAKEPWTDQPTGEKCQRPHAVCRSEPATIYFIVVLAEVKNGSD